MRETALDVRRGAKDVAGVFQIRRREPRGPITLQMGLFIVFILDFKVTAHRKPARNTSEHNTGKHKSERNHAKI